MGLSKNCVFATSIIFYTLPVVSGQLISRIISNGSEFTVKKYYHADKPTPSNSQKFIIATCSYNNKDWYERNLAATFNQNYDNYELFYVDDCSPDGTSDLVEQYITEKQANCDITLIKNKKRVTALLNLYRIIHMAKPNDIIIILDGDDWLPHDNILSFLNQIYLDKNIWFTYGQFKTYPYGDIGFCKPYPEYIIQNNSFREYDYQPSHLRTFYAWLAQQIKLEDMLYAGQFYKMTYDLALTMPMIEMTSRRHKFIPDITCIYNDATPISDHKTVFGLQPALAKVIRTRERYKSLERSLENYRSNFESAPVDAIFYSNNSPKKLLDMLQSVKNNIHQLGTCYVLYTSSNQENSAEYKSISEQFNPMIKFIEVDHDSFKYTFIFCAFCCTSPSKYLLLATDNDLIARPIYLNTCVCAMEQTHAYAFYLAPHKNVFCMNKNYTSNTSMINLGPQVFINSDQSVLAWQFKYGGFLRLIHNNNLTIYRKADIQKFFLEEDYFDSNYETIWNINNHMLKNQVGLCYEQSLCSID